jgi:enamine deaminase RidA (YjgF/YER057c/UK114 family)
MMSDESSASALAERMKRAGVVLPAALVPNAQYVPVTVDGDVLYVSGQLPFDEEGNPLARGTVGNQVSLEVASVCARRCALNLLAQLNASSAELHQLRLLKLQVFVASTPEFDQHHIVANAASDLLVEVLGERGRHARSAFGVIALPFGCPVEAEAVATIVR